MHTRRLAGILIDMQDKLKLPLARAHTLTGALPFNLHYFLGGEGVEGGVSKHFSVDRDTLFGPSIGIFVVTHLNLDHNSGPQVKVHSLYWKQFC